MYAFCDTEGQEYARIGGFEGFGYEYDAVSDQFVNYSEYDDISYAYPDLQYEKSGTQRVPFLQGVNDNQLNYEEYSYTSSDSEAMIRFYFQNEKLYCMEEKFTDTEGYEVSEVIVFKELKASAPAEWFDVDGVH